MTRDVDDSADKTNCHRLSRYDFVLVVIPVAFLFAGMASYVLSVPLHALQTGATIVSVVALIDSLFVNPPRSGSGTA